MFHELTVCSVYHSLETQCLLELNWDFAKKLNPNQSMVWIVADNTPIGYTDKVDENKFKVVPGADRVDPVPSWLTGSYRHGHALNNALKYIKTRFVVFLDIDFYIVRPRWMDEIIRHMAVNGLSFFGVPWHPAHFKKYRYFPCHHTLFVDLDRIPLRNLDFLPEYDKRLQRTVTMRIGRKLRKLLKRIGMGERVNLSRSRDTGYAIYRRYYNGKRGDCECPQPVFEPHSDLAHLVIPSRWNRVLEAFLPDRFCFVPKRGGYYVDKGFRENGYFDARGRGWEEFVWRGKPFGFHLRGSHKLQENLESGMQQVKAALQSFAS